MAIGKRGFTVALAIWACYVSVKRYWSWRWHALSHAVTARPVGAVMGEPREGEGRRGKRLRRLPLRSSQLLTSGSWRTTERFVPLPRLVAASRLICSTLLDSVKVMVGLWLALGVV